MPHRFPPPEPSPLPCNFTQSQLRRHQTLMEAWHVGNALRAYDETLRVMNRGAVPDDMPFLSSPALDGTGGARRLADNGTPATMDALCQWIDRQQNTFHVIRDAYRSLQSSLPVHARVVWLHHVNLLTCQEIAKTLNLSYRTTVRYLGAGNLYLAAALNKHADSQTARQLAKRLSAKAEQAEAEGWRDDDVEMTPDTLAYAGIETPYQKPTYKRARKR